MSKNININISENELTITVNLDNKEYSETWKDGERKSGNLYSEDYLREELKVYISEIYEGLYNIMNALKNC